ncbi:hypothetical protein DMENIID0001_001620 [Sergentomyia squamirostris]
MGNSLSKPVTTVKKNKIGVHLQYTKQTKINKKKSDMDDSGVSAETSQENSVMNDSEVSTEASEEKSDMDDSEVSTETSQDFIQHNSRDTVDNEGLAEKILLKKQNQDFKKMVDLARKKLEFRKATSISKLPEGQYFHILGMKLMKTKYGEVVLAQLADGLSVWLPKGLVNDLDIDQLITITPEDTCELAYLGKAEIDIYQNVKCKSPDVKKRE